MKRFAALYRELDASTATREKQAALQRYFAEAPAEDAAWAVYFLAGGKPRQMVPTKRLKSLAQEAAGLPEWVASDDEGYVQVAVQMAQDRAALLALNFPEAGPNEIEVLMYAALVLMFITLLVNIIGSMIMVYAQRGTK